MSVIPNIRAWLLACLALVALSGCASTGGQRDALQRAQYAWSRDIRWGDFESAWNLVDPEYRAAHPLTDVQLERYAQIQVSSYRDQAAEAGADAATRQVQIGVINRHTMAERSLRYTEQWRYDAAAGSWWITGGLPDFWAGQ